MRLHLERSFDFDAHLLSVPPGHELWNADLLQHLYKIELIRAVTGKGAKGLMEFTPGLGRSDLHFTVAPNHVLSTCEPAGVPTDGVRAQNFRFGPKHEAYRAMVGLAARAPSPRPVVVNILDTGLAADVAFSVTRFDFLSPNSATLAKDGNGHGTVVALLIHDLLPSAHLNIVKVADDCGRASEWDTLAAVAGSQDAELINISLRFGLEDTVCNQCGRESFTSRSAVFESVLGQTSLREHQPIVVAAAGNDHQTQLSFPARFQGVVAVSSITSAHQLSSFSDYGERDHVGAPHKNRYVLPGGEGGVRSESVGDFTNKPKGYWGTSFAAAYATGVIGNVLSKSPAFSSIPLLMDRLRDRAYREFPEYESVKFGNGLMRA